VRFDVSDGDDDHDHDHVRRDKENVQFWIEDPNILLNPKHIEPFQKK
jgi:hypothetical protein